MKERPILFSGALVRAILDGRKTQTRRVVAHEHIAEADIFSKAADDQGRWEFGVAGEGGVFAHGDYIRCPYGAPGDRLYVREAWYALHRNRHRAPSELHPDLDLIRYAADGPSEGRRHPGIHMPRWASRITLEVTEVRVQRLAEITEDDARAEGVEPLVTARKVYPSKHAADVEHRSYVDGFTKLWDKINGRRAPWSSNPWVWAISFRRLP